MCRYTYRYTVPNIDVRFQVSIIDKPFHIRMCRFTYRCDVSHIDICAVSHIDVPSRLPARKHGKHGTAGPKSSHHGRTSFLLQLQTWLREDRTRTQQHTTRVSTIPKPSGPFYRPKQNRSNPMHDIQKIYIYQAESNPLRRMGKIKT